MNKKITNLPVIELSSDDRLWLAKAWELLLSSGKTPTYNEIRVALKGQLSPKPTPLKIDERLIITNATSITLLGVLHVDPDTEVLKIGDAVVHHICEKINENQPLSFTTQQLASETGIQEPLLRTSVELLQRYFSFYGSATRQPDISFGFNSFSIPYDNPQLIENYLSFESFEKYIDNWYKEHSESYLSKNIKNLSQSPLLTLGIRPYVNDAILQNLHSIGMKGGRNFISDKRIQELSSIKSEQFDLTKLIELCREININFAHDNYFSVSLLVRTILNHVPPIFGERTFENVVENCGSKGNALSFKRHLQNLQDSDRRVADGHAHSLIGKKEVLPTEIQIDCRSDLDILLTEVIKKLSDK